MIIDADTHISPTFEEGISIGADELLRRMDSCGVQMVVTWLHPPYLRHIDEANRYVYQAARAHPDRILGFGWVDPNFGLPSALDMVRRCVGEYGFCGVKLNGAQNGFCIDDPQYSLPVVEAIAASGSILGLHVGADSYENTHPFRVGRLAARFPELPILAVHMGGAAFHDLSRAAIEVAGEHDNITLVGSAVRSRSILKAIESLGSERVCFGSDTPFELMHVEVARYQAMLDGTVSARERDLIMGGNVRRLFRL